MSSPSQDHHDHAHHHAGGEGSPVDSLRDANHDLAEHARSIGDDLIHRPYHRVKHHLRNSRVSAQDALNHARDALQQVASSAQASSQPIAGDLKNVLQEIDHALHALRHESGEQVLHLREALQEYAVRIRQIARDGVTQVRDSAAHGVERTQQRVASDPLKSVGIAAGVGLLVGLWLGHCAHRD